MAASQEAILVAIQRAGQELGHAPSRGELRRVTGVSHYQVLRQFRTLREAVRAAGLEPEPKGERVSTEELLADWERVRRKLGRRPSRSEYVREGKYSAGTFVMRFGSWGKVAADHADGRRLNEKADRELTRRPRMGKIARIAKTAKIAKEPKLDRGLKRTAKSDEGQNPGRLHHGVTETRREEKLLAAGFGDYRRSKKPGGQNGRWEGDLGPSFGEKTPRIQDDGLMRAEFAARDSDKAIAFQWARLLARVPGPLEGKRRVTEAVAAMVVGTLLSPANARAALGANGNWQMAISENQEPFTTESIEEHGGPREGTMSGGARSGLNWSFPLRTSVSSVVKKGRPVMGPPFDWSPLTNAPVNELGVVFLFGIVAAQLGFQVESLQGRFPDCEAKREVSPGKWQRSRIEFEYESKNFDLHGHDPDGCDVVVCWRHNWKDVPEGLEVIELGDMFGTKKG